MASARSPHRRWPRPTWRACLRTPQPGGDGDPIGSGGDPWIRAAQEVGDRLGVNLSAHKIASDAALTAPDGQWPLVAGLPEDGALLVRPDQFAGWRSKTLPADPAEALTAVLTRLLHTGGSQ